MLWCHRVTIGVHLNGNEMYLSAFQRTNFPSRGRFESFRSLHLLPATYVNPPFLAIVWQHLCPDCHLTARLLLCAIFDFSRWCASVRFRAHFAMPPSKKVRGVR